MIDKKSVAEEVAEAVREAAVASAKAVVEAATAAATAASSVQSTAMSGDITRIKEDIKEIKETLKEIPNKMVSSADYAEHLKVDEDHERRLRLLEGQTDSNSLVRKLVFGCISIILTTIVIAITYLIIKK